MPQGRRHTSGPSQPEAKRAAKVVAVRLDPQARAALDTLAARWRLSRSAVVARLAVEAAQR